MAAARKIRNHIELDEKGQTDAEVLSRFQAQTARLKKGVLFLSFVRSEVDYVLKNSALVSGFQSRQDGAV